MQFRHQPLIAADQEVDDQIASSRTDAMYTHMNMKEARRQAGERERERERKRRIDRERDSDRDRDSDRERERERER
jgi:hypothetical protein